MSYFLSLFFTFFLFFSIFFSCQSFPSFIHLSYFCLHLSLYMSIFLSLSIYPSLPRSFSNYLSFLCLPLSIFFLSVSLSLSLPISLSLSLSLRPIDLPHIHTLPHIPCIPVTEKESAISALEVEFSRVRGELEDKNSELSDSIFNADKDKDTFEEVRKASLKIYDR